ncbi:hypothetical protein KC19_10G088700 [Ceratodon purpureus]|uniref:SMP-30/Gluconolactonase/LRE-like region domain-containing protein n=1 Tax=Ceratodon purpureus TaxID=3225 RepID=A0A8T0GIA4_CERPU|nr:hypothetical protein KC19_10G088700 [Ceratodon purpureus]
MAAHVKSGGAVSRRLVSLKTVLQFAVICSSVFSLTYVDGASLPSGACYWRQGSLINHIPTGPTEDLQHCRFVVRDPGFLDLLGLSPKIVEFVKTDAHEGAVWYPDQNELYFSSNRIALANGGSRADLKKVNLKTGGVTVLSAAPTDVPNGMVLDNNGDLLVCQQGSKTQGGFIQRVNLKTGKKSVVADNWFGVPFNSPNDAVVRSDGSIWFTDPSYGSVQGFRSAPKVNNQVYRISPSGVVDAIADGFTQPNGLAFSHDEKRLYVTDTGFALGQGSFDVTRPHSITVFDIGADGLLSNRRLFASVGVYDGSSVGLGIPDGIKVDTMERVYVATVDGVQVFAQSGKPLGLIRQSGVANMGFAGKGLDTMYMLNGTGISYVKLKVL